MGGYAIINIASINFINTTGEIVARAKERLETQ